MSDPAVVLVDATSLPGKQQTANNPKAGLVLSASPEPTDIVGLCEWLTEAFDLTREHPITGGRREGIRGAAGHAVLTRFDAPPIRFEPVSRINTPARLIEDLSWQTLPSDGAVPAFKTEHCRQTAHVVRMLCGVSASISDEQETAGIVAAYVSVADEVEGFTTYGAGPQRYESVRALQRNDAVSGLPIGIPRYLVDKDTGELVIRAGDLAETARRFIGASVPRGWLEGRMDGLGWQRIHLDGHAASGRVGRRGPHARAIVYRGHLPGTDDDEAVTT